MIKKATLLLVHIAISVCASGQGIFVIPESSLEQNQKNLTGRFWWHLAPGISFAKVHGVSPYEYGTYYGEIFAESRASRRASDGSEASFKNYGQTLINGWSCYLTASDPEIRIEEESDSLLVFKVTSNVLLDYFSIEGMFGVTVDEMFQMMNGSHKQISRDYGCRTEMELKEEWIVVTVRKDR